VYMTPENWYILWFVTVVLELISLAVTYFMNPQNHGKICQTL
jgi:hypothetical protein